MTDVVVRRFQNRLYLTAEHQNLSDKRIKVVLQSIETQGKQITALPDGTKVELLLHDAMDIKTIIAKQSRDNLFLPVSNIADQISFDYQGQPGKVAPHFRDKRRELKKNISRAGHRALVKETDANCAN